MKTKIDFSDSSLESRKVTTYSYDKYPLVLLEETNIINSKGQATSYRNIHAKHNCNKPEYLKQLTLMLARYEKPCELPYTVDRGHNVNYTDDDSTEWAVALSVSHSKQQGFLFVPKERFPEFEQDILEIDFRVYDEEKSKSIRNKYKIPDGKISLTSEIDAVLIEEDR